MRISIEHLARTTRGRLLPAALATAFLALLATSASDASEGHAGSIADTFAAYSRGNDADAPGRALRAGEDAPEYFNQGRWSRLHVQNPRVLAEEGGYKLFAYRGSHRAVNFDLGDTGVGLGFSGVKRFRGADVYVLGPGAMKRPNKRGHVPLFGIASPSVARIELLYRSGEPLVSGGIDAGFVLLASPARHPVSVLAFDSTGSVIGRRSLGNVDWDAFLHPCAGPGGCSPVATIGTGSE